MPNFENIIIDLGGVLLRVEYQKTISAFKKLGIIDFEKQYSQALQNNVFDEFETGRLSEKDFHDFFSQLHNEISDFEIDHCWNSMLLDFPIKNLRSLKELKKTYRLYLLSNTNAIHLRAFKSKIESNLGWGVFSDIFNEMFFSHEIGYRKPEDEVFEYVIKKSKIDRTKTIFIDDSIQHVIGARNIGLRAFHYKQNILLEEALPGILAEFN